MRRFLKIVGITAGLVALFVMAILLVPARHERPRYWMATRSLLGDLARAQESISTIAGDTRMTSQRCNSGHSRVCRL